MLRTAVCHGRTVAVALSGGVDSSVAAALLLPTTTKSNNTSENLVGIHMSNWSFSDEGNDDESSMMEERTACTSDADWKDSVAIARHLKIPIVRRSFESDYWCHVFEPYVENFSKGITGNPDVDCNTHVKFGALLDYCKATYGNNAMLATGHYARLWHRRSESSEMVFVNGKEQKNVPDFIEASENMTADDMDWLLQWGDDPLLVAAADSTKDQTYFLSGCQSRAFRQVLFPLGDYYKKTKQACDDDKDNDSWPTVREIAALLRLPSASKRESMGICFVGKRQGGFRRFLSNYLPAAARQKLQFVDIDTGDILYQTPIPEHAVFYTPGQNARISGRPTKCFVVDNGMLTQDRDLSLPYHTVTVCSGTHHPALYSDRLYLSHIHWLAGTPPPPLCTSNSSMHVQCRIRHLQPLIDCTLTIENNNSRSSRSEAGARISVVFDVPVRAITPGQMAVFYCGLICLGGGPIAARGISYFEQGRALPNSLLHPAGLNDLSVPRQQAEEDTGR